MNQTAKDIWREKLAAYQTQRALASDPAQVFQLDKLIEEAKEKVAELESEQPGELHANPTLSKSEHASVLRLFFSYSHRDEHLRDRLATHLKLLQRNRVIDEWHDREITAGEEIDNEINTHLDAADIILLLVSADFIASDYCYETEMKRAMERHEAGDARVIPVILRSCAWHAAPFGKLMGLPTDGKPVTAWSDQDQAFTDVARGIARVAKELRQ